MTELKEIWQAYQEVGSLGVLVIFLLYVWFKRDKQDERQDEKEQTLIDVLKTFAETWAINLAAQTNKLLGIDENVDTLITNVDVILSKMTDADEAMRQRQEQITRIEQRLDRLPEAVQEQLAEAFNRMGERMSELLTRTDDINQEVKKLVTDWSAMARQLSTILNKPISDDVQASAERVKETIK